MIGPGKYDKESEELLHRFGAEGVAVLVFSADPAKSGFSVSASMYAMSRMPKIFRDTAKQIEEDLLRLGRN